MSKDQFTIFVKNSRFLVDERKLRDLPFFAQLISSGMKESLDKQVTIKHNIEPEVFRLFIKFVIDDPNSLETINQQLLFPLLGLLDCFCMDFHILRLSTRWFDVQSLPIYSTLVSDNSVYVNSGSLDFFIRHNFHRIVDNPAYLEYPAETIKFICSKDLFISSELQVLAAIMKWIDYKNSRRKFIQYLLRSIRFQHLKHSEMCDLWLHALNGNFIEFSVQNATLDRTKQFFYLVFYCPIDKAQNGLQIQLYDHNFKYFAVKTLDFEDSLTFELFHPKYCSDIWLDGKGLIRIDWKNSKFKISQRGADHLVKATQRFFWNHTNSDETHRLSYVSLFDFLHGFALFDTMKKFIVLQADMAKPWQVLMSKTLQLGEPISVLANDTKNYVAAFFCNHLFVLTPQLTILYKDLNKNEKTQRFESSELKESSLDNILITTNPSCELLMLDTKTAQLCLIKLYDGKTHLTLLDQLKKTEGFEIINFVTTFIPAEMIFIEAQ